MMLRAILEPRKDQEDNRSGARKALRLATRRWRTGRPAGAVLIHDISTQGMLLESPEKLEIGERLAVELPRSGVHETAVVWSSGDFYGCRFDKPLPAAAMSAALLKALPAGSTEEHAAIPAGTPLPERLTALRQSRGWSVERMANRLGVSRQSVWYWESGQRQPKPSMLARIAKQFGVSERELLQSPARSEPASADLEHWKAHIADQFGVAPEKVRIFVEL